MANTNKYTQSANGHGAAISVNTFFSRFLSSLPHSVFIKWLRSGHIKHLNAGACRVQMTAFLCLRPFRVKYSRVQNFPLSFFLFFFYNILFNRWSVDWWQTHQIRFIQAHWVLRLHIVKIQWALWDGEWSSQQLCHTCEPRRGKYAVEIGRNRIVLVLTRDRNIRQKDDSNFARIFRWPILIKKCEQKRKYWFSGHKQKGEDTL